MKKFIIILNLVALAFGAGACAKLLETNDGSVVEAQDHYNNFNDADNAIIGIYGKLMELIEQVIILNELRADLMDVTENSTADMVSINNHTATADNKYCNIAPFYEIILNCNDVLSNFKRMKAENKLSADEYGFRYADVMTIRCWVYLQMAIHFGNIPYITEPFITDKDLNDVPNMNFEEILQKLTESMSSLPTSDLNLSFNSPLFVSDRNEDLKMFFLNKKLMLGDLYLWTARDAATYTKAAEMYYSVIEEADVKMFSGVENRAYKMYCYVWDGSNEPGFQVCYARNKGSDLNSFRNKWKEIFNRPTTNTELSYEMITMWNYPSSSELQYPLIEIFANTGRGKWMLQPSKWAIDSLWETQVQRENGFVFDGRGRESSFDYVDGKPVVLKYLYDYYTSTTDANKTIHLQYHSPDNKENIVEGKWFIYRAAMLHLRYCEAANRAGYPDLAYALLNVGIRSYYDWRTESGGYRSNKEGVQYSGYKPANDSENSVEYPKPFYLDARFNDLPYTYLRKPWRDGGGIRGRAFVQNAPNLDDAANKEDSIRLIEDALLTEAALELGFEGHRWGDMLRFAMRRNADEAGYGTKLLNEALSKKFETAGKSAPIITTDNWFLPRKQ